MRWIWIRHGETEANRAKRYSGQLDEPLTEMGKRQAVRLSRQLAKKGLDAIYASDLQRCVDTAQVIAAAHPTLTVHATPALRECSFGAWEGKTYEELMRTDAEWVGKWLDNPFFHAPPGGETLHDLDRRLLAWVRETEQRHQGGTVCVVSHGGPLRWFWARMIRRDWACFWEPDLGPGQGWLVERAGTDWKIAKKLGDGQEE
jgi:alpha-ribazole phosphatase